MKCEERKIFFFHCLENLFRYPISKLPRKKVNFSTLNWLLPFVVDFGEQGNEGVYFRRTRLVGWLVVLRLNVPVNNFSVISGRSHRFLGN